MLVQQMASGMLQNKPEMQLFNQMMSGKNPQQQFETILNSARSKGIDVNKKMFSESDLRQMGLIK